MKKFTFFVFLFVVVSFGLSHYFAPVPTIVSCTEKSLSLGEFEDSTYQKSGWWLVLTPTIDDVKVVVDTVQIEEYEMKRYFDYDIKVIRYVFNSSFASFLEKAGVKLGESSYMLHPDGRTCLNGNAFSIDDSEDVIEKPMKI